MEGEVTAHQPNLPTHCVQTEVQEKTVTEDTTGKHPVMGSQGVWTMTVLNLVLAF
jgi:hypothetical protein